MADETDVRAALAGVVEPALALPMVELGMVKGIAIDGDTAVVAVALPLAGAERAEAVHQAVATAVLGATDLARVEVDLREMTPEELVGCARVLKHEPPPNPLKIIDANAPARPEPRINPFTDARTRVIAVSSGKGGVGKSSVTTNLSIALAQRGHTVAVVDADVWGFSIPRMLGVDRPPVVIDDMLVPPESHGVRCISMGFFAQEDQPVIWRGPMLHKALEQFLTDVYWDEPDFLVIDLPPGTGDIALSLAQFLPRGEVYVVTTPQPAAQRVAQRAAFMAQKVNLEVKGIIENMSWFTGDDGTRYEIFGAGGGQDLAERLEVPLLGQVPLLPELREGGDAGHPIVVTEPDSDAAKAFSEIARRIAVELAPTRIYNPQLKII